MPRLSLDAEFPQARAGIVIGDRSIEVRLHALDAHDVDQEAHQFMRLLREALRFGGHVRLARKQVRVVSSEHASA